MTELGKRQGIITNRLAQKANQISLMTEESKHQYNIKLQTDEEANKPPLNLKQEPETSNQENPHDEWEAANLVNKQLDLDKQQNPQDELIDYDEA